MNEENAEINYVKLHEHSFRSDSQHAGTAIESMKLIIFICKNRFCILCIVRWYLFFLNKYFIISTIIWCYAVYSDSHQNTRRKKFRAIFTITCNYIIYFIIITWCSGAKASEEEGLRDPMNIEMQIKFLCHRFFALSFGWYILIIYGIK